MIPLPPFEIIQKPREGLPCNGCGWCCHTEVCAIGQAAFKLKPTQTPCPGMIFEDNRVKCGLVIAENIILSEKPERKPLIQEALGIGKGCDSSDFIGENDG